MNKKELEVLLSKLQLTGHQDKTLEQYQTEADIASDFLWGLYMHEELEGKTLADFGCGNGILGIGALLLGAKHVYFIDVDNEATQIAEKNIDFIQKETGETFSYDFYDGDVTTFTEKVNLVISNPPFGVQQAHADKAFLLQAHVCAPTSYTFHKIESKQFLEKLSKDQQWQITLVKQYSFPLRKNKHQNYSHWKKTLQHVAVGVWKITHSSGM